MGFVHLRGSRYGEQVAATADLIVSVRRPSRISEFRSPACSRSRERRLLQDCVPTQPLQTRGVTGWEMNVGDIHQLEPNVHAGVKYLRVIIDRYFQSESLDPMTRTLFAFAAYNCGPERLRQLRREAARRGLDPNQWFNNVERITGEIVGRQTVEYVSNVYKYYVAYKLAVQATL